VPVGIPERIVERLAAVYGMAPARARQR
jgi:hypothetical protein